MDRDRKPGRFLLTGSANVLGLPRLGDSLAGRMEIIPLFPFAQDELQGRKSGFIDKVFGARPKLPDPTALERKQIASRVIAGGYPEVMTRKDPARRDAWYGAYITSILQRDVRDISNITGLTDLPRLLQALAVRSSGLLNMADLSRTLDIPHSTMRRYMALLEATFLSTPVEALQDHRGKRLVKAPKLHLADSGLAAHLAGIDRPGDILNSPAFGPLLETFVLNELRKLNGWSKVRVKAYHFRTEAGREVDIVLEDNKGRIVGIEVKAAMAVGSNDVAGGSAVFGGVLLVLHARLLSSRTLLFGLGLVFGVLCLLFVRNLFGVAAWLVITAALVGAAAKLSLAARDLLVDVLALQLILDGYDSLFTVFALARDASVRSDAQTMADPTWLPATWWAVIWMLVSTVILGALRLAVLSIPKS